MEEFKELEDQPEEWRKNPLLLLMERTCCKNFPYVCTGKKKLEWGKYSVDVQCECGSRIKT